jgi:hypothetical protein
MTTRRSLLRSLLVSAAAASGWLAAPAAAKAADLSGAWSGRWMSCTTGHNGPLRATFCRLDAAHYEVNFRGRFFKVFPFRYSVVLRVVYEDAYTTRLQGSSYLGRMFGTFYYDATVSGCEFNANYRSCKDHGWFRMTRCG